MVPLDQSVLYIRPLYLTSTSNPLPQLKYVIAVFNQDVAIEPTLSQALSQVFGANFSSGGTTPPKNGEFDGVRKGRGGLSETGGHGLANGRNGSQEWRPRRYQSEVNAMEQQIQLAQSALTKK